MRSHSAARAKRWMALPPLAVRTAASRSLVRVAVFVFSSARSDWAAVSLVWQALQFRAKSYRGFRSAEGMTAWGAGAEGLAALCFGDAVDAASFVVEVWSADVGWGAGGASAIGWGSGICCGRDCRICWGVWASRRWAARVASVWSRSASRDCWRSEAWVRDCWAMASSVASLARSERSARQARKRDKARMAETVNSARRRMSFQDIECGGFYTELLCADVARI